MDMSILERQKALLQRLYHSQQNHHSSSINNNLHHDYKELLEDSALLHHHHQQHYQSDLNSFGHFYPMEKLDPQYGSRSPLSNSNNNNSSVTVRTVPDAQCNSFFPTNTSSSHKKRKAQFDVEEDDVKEKGVEAEEESEITTKTERETSANTNSCSKVSEVEKPDYIHVRARRGQATDSHSLAERARREKISKKMKCLQDLVPGCNKVTGKAGMLDEIINYVQSLQKQVEFLSMKLATLNPRLDFSIDNFLAKEIPAYTASLPAAAAQLEASNNFQYSQILQQGITSNCNSDLSLNHHSQMTSQKAGNSSLPIPEAFLDSSFIPQLQQLSGWESDWPNPFNASFH